MLLVVAGAYFTWYGIYELRIRDDPRTAAGPVDTVTGWSSDISTWIQDLGAERLGLVLGIVVCAALLYVLLRPADTVDARRRGRRARPCWLSSWPTTGSRSSSSCARRSASWPCTAARWSGRPTASPSRRPRSGASLYALCQPDDLRWHIPSVQMDPADSPALGRFLAHVDVVLSVHGYGRDGLFTTLLLGGGDRSLAAHVAGHLRAALPGYTVEDDLAAIPKPLRGLHPDNPVNRTGGGGVQIELPPRIRLQGPNADPAARQALVAGLAAAASALTARGG